MSGRKILKYFSTIFLTVAVLSFNGADLRVFAGEYVLGGISPAANINSECVYIVERTTDIPVFAKNERKRVPPASTAKIMTCLLTLENVPDLDDGVKFTYDATNEFYGKDPNKWDAANAGLDSNPLQDNLTYRDCVYALMLRSACETANILAYNIGDGDISKFVDMMNKKAADLGCTDTHFSNPHGLYESDNLTTAYDMFLITRYALDTYPLFAEICSAPEWKMPENNISGSYSIENRNMLLNSSSDNPYYYEFARGIKTGSLDYFYDYNETTQTWDKSEGGIANLVSYASRGEFTYIIVTLGAPYFYGPYNGEDGKNLKNLNYAYLDHILLYKWSFNSFGYKKVISMTDPVRSVKVLDGDGVDEINLFAQMTDDFYTLLPNDLDETAIQSIVVVDNEEIEAPVSNGAVLGSIEFRLANKTLGKYQLVSTVSVEKSKVAETKEKFAGIFKQPWFKPLVAILALLVIMLIIINFMRGMTAHGTDLRGGSQKSGGRKKQPNRKIRR